MYSFPQFRSLGLIEPEFYLNSVRDDIQNRTLTAELCFQINDEIYAIDIDWAYNTTWEDDQVLTHCLTEINKFKIDANNEMPTE